MRNKLTAVLLTILISVPFANSYGFIGFGLNINQDMVTVDGSITSSTSGLFTAQMDRQGFENAFGIGGFLYLDFLPIIDLELDFQLAGNTYDFEFSNFNDFATTSTGPVEFAWLRASGYLTVTKKIIGIGVPILGNVKIMAGAGLNSHTTTPYASIEMMEELLGDALYTGFNDSDAMADNIVSYITENTETITGLHFQAGLKFKVLVLNGALTYRYTLADEVYAGSGGFGGLNIRLGLGF